MKRFWISLAALVLSACVLTGCSADPAQWFSALTGEETQTEEPAPQQPAEEAPEMAQDAVLEETETLDILRLAYQTRYGLNPFTTQSLCNRAILPLLYEPLYVVNARFEAEPVLAKATAVSEDALTTTITLQSGVRFHNGKVLTAQDVVYSFTQAKASDYYGNRFIHIDEVAATDPYTVTVTTDTACEAVSLLLDFPIVPENTADQPVPPGTGPFVYGAALHLERFADWWQDELTIPCNAVELTVCDTSSDIRDQFEYGNVNLVWSDPKAAAYASFHNDSESWYSPTTVMQYVGFNANKKAFSNSHVRACVTYAIDRETIVAEDMSGSAEAASLPASPLSACYDKGLAAKYDYDLDDFQAVLDAGQIQDYTADGILDVYHKGYSVPLAGTMIVSAGNTQRRLTATRIAEALNDLGFDITVEVLEPDAYASALRYGNYDLYYAEIRLSANFDLGPFFRNGGSAAYGGLSNGAALSLCENLLENRGNAYDLHKRVMDQGYFCPVVFKSYTVYTTRGAAENLSPALDWVIHADPAA